MPITVMYAVVAVRDLDAALEWYERLLGRPADELPMDGLAQWQLSTGGGMQLLRDSDHAGGSLVTFIVDDLQAEMATLTDRGLTDGAITTGDKARFTTITDPEGNVITFAEPITAAD